MKILFPVNERRIDGPENWRRVLINEISKSNNIFLITSWNPYLLFKKIYQTDVLHSYSQSPLTVFSLLIAKIFHKKIVHTVHGDYYAEQENKKGLKKILWIPFNKICTFLADKTTFPSKYLYNKIKKRESYLKNKSVIIPNGIDIEKIKSIKGYSKRALELKKSDFLIVEVTNFNLKQKAKGIDLLVKDFNRFIGKKTNSYLFIIGGGKLLEKYKQKYESYNIKFLGFKKDVLKYIKASDIFVHYSFLDSFGYVLLEAMACKKQVLAFGSKAFNEILQIKRLDYPIKKRFNDSQNKKIILNKFSIKRIGKEYLRVYNEI